MTSLKLVEGYMPMQMLFELAFCVAVFAGISYLLSKSGVQLPRFWQGILFWVFILMYLKYRIYPPIPFSVRAMYGTVSLIAVFMWMSSNEDDWRKFKQPIMNVMDGITPFHKILRVAYLVALPFVFWAFSYNSFYPI